MRWRLGDKGDGGVGELVDEGHAAGVYVHHQGAVGRAVVAEVGRVFVSVELLRPFAVALLAGEEEHCDDLVGLLVEEAFPHGVGGLEHRVARVGDQLFYFHVSCHHERAVAERGEAWRQLLFDLAEPLLHQGLKVDFFVGIRGARRAGEAAGGADLVGRFLPGPSLVWSFLSTLREFLAPLYYDPAALAWTSLGFEGGAGRCGSSISAVEGWGGAGPLAISSPRW